MRRICGAVPATLMLTASALALSLATVVPTMAQNRVWDGSESSDWRDGNNWVGDVAPGVPGYALGSDGTANPIAPYPHMPAISGGSLAFDSALFGYSNAQGGLTVTIANGANVTSNSVVIGEGNNAMPTADRSTQSGQVNVVGGSTWNTTALTVGSYGDGMMNVTGGSKVTAGTLSLGLHRVAPQFATGELMVSGVGSALTVTSTSTAVGTDGEGFITIANGGKLTTDSTALGVSAGSSGTITITGPGSTWARTGGTLNLGLGGVGSVVVSNGGIVTSTGVGGNVNLGTNAGSSGSLTVTDAGSRFDAAVIYAGRSSSADVSVSAGGVVNATHLLLGAGTTGIGTATLSGAGSLINTTTYTSLGYGGQGTLTLSEGATLRSPLVHIGQNAVGSSSSGTLNIGAAAGNAAVAAGTVDATEVRFGPGVGTLVFNHTDANLNFAAKLTGGANDTIRQVAGTTTLSGNAGGFAGTTQIDGGLLRALNGLGGNIVVNSGGTLAPTGTLHATTASFAAGSTYQVATSNGATDKITAAGAVTINGGTVQYTGSNGALDWSTPQTVVSAGTTLTGAFNGITSQLAFLDTSLDYSSPNLVRIAFARNNVSFASVAETPNQQGVGEVLSNLPASHPLVQALAILTQEQAQDAMNQLSGDTQATLETAGASIAGQVQNVLMNRIRQAFSAIGAQGSAVSSYAPRLGEVDAGERPDISYWLQGLGEYAHVDATATSGGLRSGTAGILGGSDVAINEWRVGVVGGYTGTGYTAEGRPADGSINNIHAGIYAGAEFDALSVQFNALQTWHGISSRRNVSFGGLNETLTADYGAQTSLVFGEVGYGFDLGAVELEPFGSVAYSLGQTDAYSESGGASALSVAASTQQSVTTVIGVRPEMAFAIDDKLLTVRGMLGWQHQAGETPTGSYSLAGSSPFTVTGSSLASDALVYETGLNLDVSENLNLDLLYSGRLAPTDFSQGIKGIVAAKF